MHNYCLIFIWKFLRNRMNFLLGLIYPGPNRYLYICTGTYLLLDIFACLFANQPIYKLQSKNFNRLAWNITNQTRDFLTREKVIALSKCVAMVHIFAQILNCLWYYWNFQYHTRFFCFWTLFFIISNEIVTCKSIKFHRQEEVEKWFRTKIHTSHMIEIS